MTSRRRGVVLGLCMLLASCGGSPRRATAFDSALLVPSPEPPAEPCRASQGFAVFFAPGSSEVDSTFQPEGNGTVLARVVEAYREGAFHHVRLTGWVERYCPSAPSTPELAMERAVAVRDRLAELGLPPEAVEIWGTLPAGTIELGVEVACDPDRPMILRTVQIEALECDPPPDPTGSASP